MSLESARAIEQAATPGPWLIDELNMDKYPESEFGYPQRILGVSSSATHDGGPPLVAECFQEPMLPDNARFIAHVRTAYPLALDVIEAASVLVDWCFANGVGNAELSALLTSLMITRDAFEATT